MARLLPLLRALPFAAFGLLAVAYEPIQSDFAVTLQGCALRPTGPQLAAAFTNGQHLVAFFVLFLLAALAFGRRPLALAAATVFALSLTIEATQAVFDEGHCRAWDLIPNAIAIAAGWATVGALLWGWRRLRA